MDANTHFWGAIICANVWMVAGNKTMASIWGVFALGIFVAEKFFPEKK